MNLYTLADFVIAFGKWLRLQRTTDKMRRCSLTSFKLTAVECFTRDLDAASPEATKHMLDDLCKEIPGRKDFLAVNSLHAESLLKLHLSLPDSAGLHSDPDSDSSSERHSHQGSQPTSVSASARRNMSCFMKFRGMWRRSQAHQGEMPELQELEEDEVEGASAARIEKASLEPFTDSQHDLAKAEPASERFANLLCDPRTFDGASGAGLGEDNDCNGLLSGDSGDSFSSTTDSEDSSLDLDRDDAGTAPAEGAAASKHPLTAEVKPVLMRPLSFSSEFRHLSCLDV
jgi:hypothetical protein